MIFKLEHYSVKYPEKEKKTLNDINLTVRRADKLLILGPSGCGKSTLLYSLAGIIPSLIYAETEGRFIRKTENIALVMQNPEAQMIAPTVEEELAFALENKGIEPAEIRKRIERIISEFKLDHLRERDPSSLSGGEMQQIALISALITEPDILLLDEPLSYLDQNASFNFLQKIRNLRKDMTMIIVDHRIQSFYDLVNDIIFLDKEGRISYKTAKDELVSCLEREHKIRKNLWLEDNLTFLFGDTIGKTNKYKEESRHKDYSEGTAIRVKNLNFSYNTDDKNHSYTLHEISMEIPIGKTIIITGPNGAGKTTLLDNIAAFYRQTFSSVEIEGKTLDIMTKKDIYSLMDYVPQNPEHFFLKDTVKEELSFAGRHKNKEEVFKIFNPNGLLEQNPYSLSEGEKRRLSIEILFLEKRNIILMDEPTYGLDFDSFVKLAEGIMELKKKRFTLLIATHNPDLIFLLADRVFFMKNGTLVFNGSPGEYRNFLEHYYHGPLLLYYIPTWERGEQPCCQKKEG